MNKLTPYLEKIFIASLAAGILIQYLETSVDILINISLGGLAVSFLLNIYRPLEINPSEDEELGFGVLLGVSIVPKVLFLGSAIGLFGILIYNLSLPHDGHLRVMYPAGLSIAIATLIFLGLKISGTKYINVAFPVLLRGLIVLAVILYILFG